MSNPDVKTGSPIPVIEQTLLRAAKRGDQSAFEDLVVPLRGRIFGVAKRILRNHEDAEDVVQVSLLQAFRHLATFRGHSRFSTWLTHIVINESLMLLRASATKQPISLDQVTERDDSDYSIRVQVVDSRPTPEQHYAAEERRAVLARSIAKIHPVGKKCLEMRFFQELSLRETARLLGISVGAVKSRSHHARRALRQAAKRQLANSSMRKTRSINADHSKRRQ